MEKPRSSPVHIHGKSKVSVTPIIFFLLFRLSMAEIPIGSVLYASDSNQTWSSPSRNFSLHFIKLNSSSYSLALTYADTLPVWVAGADASAAVDAAGSFRFLPNGDLQLRNGSGAVLWRAGSADLGVSGAALEDSGNFVLKNSSGSVWTSFEHPSDTILPSQNFTTAMVLKSGSYSFILKPDGNLTLLWNNTVNYWNLGFNSSVNASLQNPNLAIQSTGILNLYDAELPTSIAIAYSSDYVESDVAFRFLKLDDDGNLRIYSSKGTTTPTVDVTWTAVTDQCEVFGYCGNFGVCSYNDTGPICGCPSKNFDPVDPDDSRKGCRRKQALKDCSSPTMVTMEHTKLLTYSNGRINGLSSSGIDSCRSNCLGNLTCLASTALGDGSGLCDHKMEGFVSAYQSAALPSTTFVKVCGPVSPNAPLPSQDTQNSKKPLPWIVVAVVLGTLFTLALVEVLIWWWCCRKMQRFGGGSAHYALLEYASGAPVQFPYKELHRATKGFKEKLGSGGFGAVYKGILVNRTPVAVKQLEGIEQGEKQFRMEVATISSTHHLNLVRLIGFCSEARHRLLVYEFMSHGSLDAFLFPPEGETGKFLSWERRIRIAIGTARGITYLHEECRDCIVHCDIKPENILLDEGYNAKVSDFGLAKLVDGDCRGRTLRSLRGTRGYVAPEWLANLPVSSKCDVYSYGMVLLEMVSGRRNFEVSRETGGRRFWVWAYGEYERGNVEGIVDGRILGEMEGGLGEIVRVIKVGFWCIQEQPSQRPTMGRVVQMLEGVVGVESPPAPNAAHEGSVVVPAPRGAMSVEETASTIV